MSHSQPPAEGGLDDPALRRTDAGPSPVATPSAGRGRADRSYDLTEVVDTRAIAAQVAQQIGASCPPVEAGNGLEFTVYRAQDPRHGDVALRVPRYRTYRFPGRIPFSARQALTQERVLCSHLHAAGIPVAQPLRLVSAEDVPVLVSRFLTSERHGADSTQIGELLARLHQVPPPRWLPLDHDGYPVAEAMARRLSRRWNQLRHHLADLPAAPSLPEIIAGLSEVAESPALVHLDIRACNLLSSGDRIVGLVDWSCALLAHPAVELARSQEYAQLSENGLEWQALVDGYRRIVPSPTLSRGTEALVRLDTVVMLGVIFYAYAPDPERQEWVRRRVLPLSDQAFSSIRNSR